MLSTVQIYTSKEDADAQAQSFRKTGWPGATAIENGNGKWVISAHKANCKCGMCPVIHTNGYFESD